MQEYVFSPHYDFFINKVHRDCAYNMRTFHFHKKYEIYFQSEGIRRYYIGDSAYLVNAGSVVIINHDSIHKTGSVDDSPHTRFVVNFSREFLLDIQATMPDVDIFACFESGIVVLPLLQKRQRIIETLLNELWDGNESEGSEALALRKLQMTALLIYLGKYTAEEQHREG
ncbi:MAG: AraC family ligand binding domain-containing protein, partial [Angelakisella sp.]